MQEKTTEVFNRDETVQIDGGDGRDPSEPTDILTFLNTLFEPTDHITFRPIETWTEQTGRKRSRVLYDQVKSLRCDLLKRWLPEHLRMLDTEQANGFFGVCPRSWQGEGSFELAWQIPTVRCLWVDVDDGTPDEALSRIEQAGLPAPSIVVSSGNGGHFYWLLESPIQTEADTRPVLQHWVQSKGRRKPIPYINEGDRRIYLSSPDSGRPIPVNRPALTETAQQVQDVCQGIAAAIGGDHTQDLSRLLRLPGTMNRKNQRNGDEPKPCTLVTCDPDLRYPYESFVDFAKKSPDRERREKIAKVQLPAIKRLTPTKTDGLSKRILACEAAPEGHRSEADFALCCYSVEKGIDPDEVWDRCSCSGKFAERGEEYFQTTWANAQQHTREQMFQQAQGEFPVSTSAPAAPDSDGPTKIELVLDELFVSNQIVEVLASRTNLYNFTNQLAEIREVSDGDMGERAVATVLPAATLREIIANHIRFFTEAEGSDGQIQIKYQRVQKWCIEAVSVRGQWKGIPVLRRVVQCPVLRSDGTVLQTPGYDEASQLYLDQRTSFERVPEEPTFTDVTSSVDLLMDLVCDFPFVDDRHRAAWLASLLTPFARETYSGPTGPLFTFDASQAGSGKTLLADLVSLIVCGQPAKKQSAPRDDEEFRKNITARAINSNPIELIDNVVGRFGCASLDAALTSSLWTDRELQRSRTVEAPLRMTWLATGNNIQFAADLSRRVCHVRLEPTVERQDEEDGFKHRAIQTYVLENRAKFVAAALTILRGFFAAGKPDQDLPNWGSFEGWSSVVRNAVVWAGLPDPGLTRQEVHQADDNADSLAELIRGLKLVDPQRRGLRAAEMVRIAQRHSFDVPVEHCEVLRDAIEEFTQSPIERVGNRLAYRLKTVRKQIQGAHYIDRKTVSGQRLWVVCGCHGDNDCHDDSQGADDPV